MDLSSLLRSDLVHLDSPIDLEKIEAAVWAREAAGLRAQAERRDPREIMENAARLW